MMVTHLARWRGMGGDTVNVSVVVDALMVWYASSLKTSHSIAIRTVQTAVQVTGIDSVWKSGHKTGKKP